MNGRLPSFFVIGAQKAGTTSLHDWLVQQPDVRLPTMKETHFFSHEDRFCRGIDWYLHQFSGSRPDSILGEVDPEYLFFEAAPARIKKFLDSPRFIVLLRHPLDRAYSQYQMTLRRGFETLSFTEALLAEKERLAGPDKAVAYDHFSYISRSMYCDQILRYKKIFPASCFLFIKFDEMVGKDTGLATYGRICEFIGVKSSPEAADRSTRSNMASSSRSKFLTNLLYRPNFIKSAVARCMPSVDLRHRIWLAVDRLNLTPLKQSKNRNFNIPDPIGEKVKLEISSLENVTGLNLKDWIEKTDMLYGAPVTAGRFG